MKYAVYITQQIDSLDNKTRIGYANTAQEACRILHEYLESSEYILTPYWRYLFCSEATFIDFGSWSSFGAIVPAVSIEEIQGEKSND